MTNQTHIEASLISDDGATLRARIPFPLPEAVLHGREQTANVKWEPGAIPPEKQFVHRRYYLNANTGESPEYSQAGEEAVSFVRLCCRACEQPATYMFAHAVPRTFETKITDIGWTCESCYREDNR